MNMGINTITAISQLKLPPAAKSVLTWLAYHNNDKTNVCSPSMALLAKETCLSPRATAYALKALEDGGHIRRKKRVNKNGKYVSSQYIIAFPDTAPHADAPCAYATDADRYMHQMQGVSAPRAPSLEQKYNKNMEQEERRRATRLPADWMLSVDDLEFCCQKRPDLNPQVLFKKFLSYYTVGKGKDTVRDDWSLTWREWVIREDTSIPAVKTEESWGGFMSRVANQKEERVIDAECTLLLG